MIHEKVIYTFYKPVTFHLHNVQIYFLHLQTYNPDLMIIKNEFANENILTHNMATKFKLRCKYDIRNEN